MPEHSFDEHVERKFDTPATDPAVIFTVQEWSALLRLRRRYRDNPGLWTARELEHLRFYRWLHERALAES